MKLSATWLQRPTGKKINAFENIIVDLFLGFCTSLTIKVLQFITSCGKTKIQLLSHFRNHSAFVEMRLSFEIPDLMMLRKSCSSNSSTMWKRLLSFDPLRMKSCHETDSIRKTLVECGIHLRHGRHKTFKLQQCLNGQTFVWIS